MDNLLDDLLEPPRIDCEDLEQRVKVVCDLHSVKNAKKPGEAYSIRWRMRALLIIVDQEIQWLSALKMKLEEELAPPGEVIVEPLVDDEDQMT